MPSRRADLLAAWAMALAARLIVALIVQTPTVLGDEVEYFLAARQPEGHPGLLSLTYPPLYPALLRPVATIGSRETAYLLCRLQNAFVSSTVVPLTSALWGPAGLWGGCLVGLLPSGVITSGLLLSENLFAPLLALWLWAAVRWSRHPSAVRAALMGGVAACAALTRAAGGAVILATLAYAALRRISLRQALVILGTLAPVAIYLLLRHYSVQHPFNDPLAVSHPREIARSFTLNLHDLTGGTILAGPARWLPWPWLFAAAWLAYWSLQYGLYLVIATAGFAFGVGNLRDGDFPSRDVRAPLLAVSLFGIALAANHTLAGAQAEQFVRGRYVEPLVPIWVALGVGLAAARGRMALPLKALPFLCLAGVVALTAAQNRSTDFLYPVRSIALHVDPPVAVLIGAAVVGVAFLSVRVLGQLRGAWRAVALSFLLISLPASAVRFWIHHGEAHRQAVPARWLAAHDPEAWVGIRTEGRPADSLKASGVAWAAQHIRFFSDNRLCLYPDSSARYALRSGGEGIVCAPPGRRGGTICLARENPR